MKTRDGLSKLGKGELIARLVDASCEASSLREECNAYKSERDEYRAKLDRSHAERDRLRAIIVKLQRHQFGRRSEHLSPDQLQLALEDLAQTLAAIEAEAEAKAEKSPQDEQKRRAAAPQYTLARRPHRVMQFT